MSLSKQPYRGTRDFFPKEQREQNFLFEKLHHAAKMFGYSPYNGPMLEEVELYLAKSGEELVGEQMYAFTDRGNRKVAIRPEMTPTLARMVAQIIGSTPLPIRMYSIPNLYRYENPQRGRLREHWQFNADIFGAKEGAAEEEILLLIIYILKSLGPESNPSLNFNVCLNDRRLVDELIHQKLQLAPKEAKELYRLLDQYKKNSPEANADRLKKLPLQENKQQILSSYLKINSFAELKEFIESYHFESKQLLHFYEGHPNISQESCILFDPTIVRGLDYYTGIVFEVFDLHPQNKRAICGGGSYANLLKIFDLPPVHAVGVGMGDVTLYDFAQVRGLIPDLSQPKYTVCGFYLTDEAHHQAVEIAGHLRNAGVDTWLFPKATKPQKALQLGLQYGARFLFMLGEDELAQKKFKLKSLHNKEEQLFSMNQLKDVILYVRNQSH